MMNSPIQNNHINKSKASLQNPSKTDDVTFPEMDESV